MKKQIKKSNQQKFQQVAMTSKALKEVKGGDDFIIIEEIVQN